MKKLMLMTGMFAFMLAGSTLLAQCSGNGSTAKAVQVSEGGDKDIVDIAMASDAHSTLVAAVKAAGLVETLKGEGPFTVFAPVNSAFEALPAGTVETLLQPENKATLTAVLTYHVVAGNFTSDKVVEAIRQSGGTATLTTVQGGELQATLNDGKVYLIDENDNRAQVTTVDLKGTNGVIHVVDTVVLPK